MKHVTTNTTLSEFMQHRSPMQLVYRSPIRCTWECRWCFWKFEQDANAHGRFPHPLHCTNPNCVTNSKPICETCHE